MNAHDHYDELMPKLQALPFWKLCHPRRYVPPEGYSNPRYNAAAVAAGIINAQLAPMFKLDKTQVDIVLVSWALIENHMPTIFVAREFAEALCSTDPPSDMMLSDLHWPFEAMTFVLPLAFQRSYFGRSLPFMRVARVNNGKRSQPEELEKLAPCKLDIGIQDHPGGYGFFVTFMAEDEGHPYDFSGSFHIQTKVSDLLNAEFSDFTKENVKDYKPDDQVLLNRALSCAVQFLLALNAVPEHLEDLRIARETRVKRGIVVREELWHPRMFGKNWHWVRPHPDHKGGQHASPRLHPRRGHWRNQAFGTKHSLRKLIWLEPTLVGAKNPSTDECPSKPEQPTTVESRTK